MKTIAHIMFFPAWLAVFPMATHGQGGPLTPPAGVPGPTMKSLDEVEPRTPLVDGAPGVFVAPSGTVNIAESGSYYLTGNLAVAGGHGIAASYVINCEGSAHSADPGISSLISVRRSTGFSDGGNGVQSDLYVSDSLGFSWGAGDGIEGAMVTNSFGQGGTGALGSGIRGHTVHNSYGIGGDGDGINASNGDNSYCRGTSTGAGADAYGISAVIAVACTATGGELITNKYQMP